MAKIENEADFRLWLESLPDAALTSTAAALALRAALRVMPLISFEAGITSFDVLLKAIVRLCPSALFVLVSPSPANADAARSAARYAIGAGDTANSGGLRNAVSQGANFAAVSSAFIAADASLATGERIYVDSLVGINAAGSAGTSIAPYIAGPAGRGANRAAVQAAFVGTWGEIEADATFIEQSRSLFDLLMRPLFASQKLEMFIKPHYRTFHAALEGQVQGIPVWKKWYEKLLSGHRFSKAEASAYVFLEGADWETSSLSEINAAIRAKLESLERLGQSEPQEEQQPEPPSAKTRSSQIPDVAELGSPDVTIGSSGKLALRSNPTYDSLRLTADGLDLVEAQRAVLAVIDSSIPSDGPQHLRVAIDQYRDALPSGDRQSKAIVLSVMFPVIVREIRDTKDQNWIASGVLVSCKTFQRQHPKLMDFARSQKEWNKKVAAVPLNEDVANDPKLRKHLRDLDDKLLDAVRVGIAEQPVADLARGDLAIFDNLPRLTDADRVQPKAAKPSPRKKWLVSRLVFWKRLATLTPAAVTVVKDGPDALGRLQTAANAILEFLKKYWPL